MPTKQTSRQIAVKIVTILRSEGYQALFAGGCVRDKILGRPAKDYDVVTDAHPKDVMRIFKHTIKVGAKFGVVMVMLHGQQIEVATFRTETDYADGRHPDKVQFATAREDASRRDFTINGMFFDPIDKQVFDYVRGRVDIEKRIIRTIGEPSRRFAEDYLRMLRAVRFSTQLDFAIEKKTWYQITHFANKITSISGERIAMEFESILTNPRRAEGGRMLWSSGLASAVFNGLKADQAEFGIGALARLPEKIDFPISLAALFAGCDQKLALKSCKVLRLSNAHTRHLTFLLKNREILLDDFLPLSQLKMLAHEPYFWDLYNLQKAIQNVKGESLSALTRVKKRALELKGKNLRPKALLDGHELIGLGTQPGPMVGLVSQEMYIAQLGEEIKTKPQAKKWVADFLQKHK